MKPEEEEYKHENKRKLSGEMVERTLDRKRKWERGRQREREEERERKRGKKENEKKIVNEY